MSQPQKTNSFESVFDLERFQITPYFLLRQQYFLLFSLLISFWVDFILYMENNIFFSLVVSLWCRLHRHTRNTRFITT